MSRKTWYLIALSFPFLIPALLAQRHMEVSSGILGIIRVILVLQLVYGGIQYLFFCAGVLWWSWNKTADQIARIAWLLPLVFVLVYEAGFFLWYAVIPEGNAKDLTTFWLFGLTTPLYGFFYLGLAQALTALLHHIRVIED